MVNGGRFPPPQKIPQKTPKEQKQNKAKAIGFQKTPTFCKSEKQIVGMYIKKILDFPFLLWIKKPPLGEPVQRGQLANVGDRTAPSEMG